MTSGRAPQPSRTPQWRALREHYRNIRKTHMRDLFAQDPDRARRFTRGVADLTVDFSKHRITDETLTLLLDLAHAVDMESRIQEMFSGAPINLSEKRPALHVALRAPAGSSFRADGVDVMPAVHAELERMHERVRALDAGELKGWTGKSIGTLVNIGIGGSDLGPRLAVEALHARRATRLHVRFVTNLDGRELRGVLGECDPETTLFVVASKSFTTLETLTNADSARLWLTQRGCTAPAAHFLAVTCNEAAALAWGIPADRIHRIWDWVGGRFSVWSSVGLPLALQIGYAGFQEFCDGAHAMDRHFRQSPLQENVPVLLALLDVWYADFFRAATHAVIPYDQRLRLLPEYLGQLMMESNGKRVDRHGRTVRQGTSPVVWGALGTNAQHAFFQLLHQGTQLVPVEFLLALHTDDDERHQLRLVASCLAQSKALMLGREGRRHRHFPGNQPSTTFLYPDLTPFMLGALLALYEQRTFAQSVLWGINAFDQWGVELGKQLTKELVAELEGGASAAHDSSTAQLLDTYRKQHKTEKGSE